MNTTNRSAQPLLVTAAIIERQGSYLITQRPEHKPHGLLWEFPGGKMEANESPEQALRRELHEELAIEIEVDSIFDVIYHRYDWGPVMILAYRCHWLSGDLKHLEVADHRWVTAAEMSRISMLPADDPLCKRLLNG